LSSFGGRSFHETVDFAMKVLNQYVPLPTLLSVAYELVAACASIYLGALARYGAHWPTTGDVAPSLPKALFFGVLAVVGLAAMGLYQAHFRRLSREAIVARIVAGLGLAALGETAVFYAVPSLALGRGVWGLSLLFTFVLILLGRAALVRFLSEDAFRRRILVYGAGNMAASLLTLRRRSDQRGFKIIAFFPAPGDRYVIEDQRVVPGRDLAEYAAEQEIDEIVVAMDDKRQGFPIRDLLAAKFAGVDVVDILGFLERESGKVDVERMNPSWMIFADGFTRKSSRQIASRTLDIAGGLALLVVAWPFMLLVALAVWMEDGSPVLYRQTRVGLFGKPFELLKFRSMTKEAEADGAKWAQKDDRRITKTGSVIRKLRLDELPQILNIIRGQMSLVGPRPERPEFVKDLAQKIPYYQERHCVKPGLTGWAQLQYPYGASEKDALEKLRYDLFYVKNQSFLLDLIILLQTAEVIIWQKGSR
jgi:sugar transferase (PEP-CTERM system associated)